MIHPAASSRSVLMSLAFLLLAIPAVLNATTKTSEDALARAEFDRELSLDMKDLGVIQAFRVLSKVTSVPFVIDFEDDPTLRVTFKAENMVSRAVLASLASTYGLTFSDSVQSLVVRRPGFPPAATGTSVGASPDRTNGAAYRLEFALRKPGGGRNFSGAFNLKKGMVGRLTLDAKGNGGLEVSDRARTIAEAQYSGGLELRVSVQGESNSGLDLLTELVTSRPLTTESYAEDHLIRNLRGLAGEIVLAQTATGAQLVLTRWTRLTAP
jgi:hypothetical protein